MNHLITDLPASIHEKNQETNLISVSMSLINVPDIAIPITREKRRREERFSFFKYSFNSKTMHVKRHFVHNGYEQYLQLCRFTVQNMKESPPGSKSHCPTHMSFWTLQILSISAASKRSNNEIQVIYLWHKNNTWVFCVWVKLSAICILQLENGTCILDNSYLHAQAYAKKWYIIFSSIFCCNNFSLNSPVTKTSRN